MIVFLNGKFVKEGKASIPIHDRGFLYGDGLFETMRIHGGVAFRWRDHFRRLQQGARLLKLRVPVSGERLEEIIAELARKNKVPEALARLTLSRGSGPRGYSPRGANRPTLLITLTPFVAETEPPVWDVHIASHRLPANQPLAQYKTCNKLVQILARAEADDAGADEALLLNTAGNVVESSSGNLFWIKGGTVCTPALASGILAGVTRSVVREICERVGIPFVERNITPDALMKTDGGFISLSSRGIVEIRSVNERKLKRSPLPPKLREEYQRLQAEGGGRGQGHRPAKS